MNRKAEGKNDLGAPVSLGTTLGAISGIAFGPLATILGFAVGAGLGFWYNRKRSNPMPLSGNTPADRSSREQLLH